MTSFHSINEKNQLRFHIDFEPIVYVLIVVSSSRLSARLIDGLICAVESKVFLQEILDCLAIH